MYFSHVIMCWARSCYYHSVGLLLLLFCWARVNIIVLGLYYYRCVALVVLPFCLDHVIITVLSSWYSSVLNIVNYYYVQFVLSSLCSVWFIIIVMDLRYHNYIGLIL